MKLLVFEYACAGGQGGYPFLSQGKTMLRSLLSDLSGIDNISTLTILSPNLTGEDFPADKIIEMKTNFWPVIARQIGLADAVWMIAPETEGILKRITELAESLGKKVIGCSAGAIEICGDKLKTFKALKGKVSMPDTVRYSGGELSFPAVLKPIDGAGSESVFLFKDKAKFVKPDGRFIWQNYINGVSLSVGVVGSDDSFELLGICRQVLSHGKNLIVENLEIVYSYEKIDSVSEMVEKVVSSISGLRGYYGLDFIDNNGTLTLIEINPRLTASYPVYSKALKGNLACKVLNSFLVEHR